MSFISPDLETILPILDRLSADTKPQWGIMSAQRMVEHLTDVLRIATGENPQGLLIPEEKIEKMQEILASDKPMPVNFEVPFAPMNAEIRNEELELAVDEFVDTWLHFEDLYGRNPELTHLHPYYGPLNYDQWQRIQAKHLTHHFKQFGLLEE